MNQSNKIDINIDSVFKDVLKLVKGGMTIENACHNLNIPRDHVYRRMSKDQKNELKFNKVAHAKYDKRGLSEDRILINEF